MHRIYIGFDPREEPGYKVAEFSLRRHATEPVFVTPLILERLEQSGLSTRPYRKHGNALWDVLSDAPCSTEFSNTRFLVPLLAQTGWALFVDCDMLFLGDVANLFALADDRFAVQVVKHQYEPKEATKMDGCEQTRYARKNWSSVMLFNCDHPANRALTLDLINRVPGRYLHGFCWLRDDEIGALPAAWNWLVDVEPRPFDVQLAHYTLGLPFMAGYETAPYSGLWLAERALMGMQ